MSPMLPSPEFPSHIDSTMLSCFRACPQKFHREFILGLRPAHVSIHLHAGGAFASAVEAVRAGVYNQGLTLDDALLAAFQVFHIYWRDYSWFAGENKSFFNTWRGVDSYFERFDPTSDHIHPYKTRAGGTFEFTFAIPLPIAHPVTGLPILFAGRIDLLGEYAGSPVVVDEKTTVYLGSSYASKFKLRGQFLGYCWAAQQAGIPVTTAVVRATGLKKTEIDHLEIIQPYTQELITRWHSQMLSTVGLMVSAWDTARWAYNFGDSCEAYGGCPFADLCSRSPSTESTWYTDYDVRRWNPLSRSPTDGEAWTPTSTGGPIELIPAQAA